MSTLQMTIMIGLAVLATQITRWAPFLLFRKRTPAVVAYLGSVLPSAIWGMLVVYCFRNGPLVPGSNGVPEAAASLVTIGLQFWKRNMAISIAGGTFCYMTMIQLFF